MQINDTQADHFHRNGFFLVETPFPDAQMQEIDRLFRETEEAWEAADWDPGFNSSAYRFFMIGEPAFQLAEHPDVLNAARELLNTDKIHIGACGLGDSAKRPEGSGRHQVYWHADGSPEVKQVSIRTALDRHDPTNGPLRVLPGTQVRPGAEMKEELLQLELASGQHDTLPTELYAKHPHEVELILDPRWTLVWTPCCWHATGKKTGAGPRRAICWNYYPQGGRHRDRDALKSILDGVWQNWTLDRKTLWGLE
jgi:ectoine hydroxylase-related dioxygenase (phytanoyl-CoA dioxygenase family)